MEEETTCMVCGCSGDDIECRGYRHYSDVPVCEECWKDWHYEVEYERRDLDYWVKQEE